ncbi:MAG: hypothetical protein C5B58_00135 [Acidobacteria bacterium]|nr:MAG: hypothetical protein C5B58_00135 [Acidobacteriota bacterium]
MLAAPRRPKIEFEEREPEAYFDIYRGLLQANVDFVVIGGRVCNIWALAYEDSAVHLYGYRCLSQTPS